MGMEEIFTAVSQYGFPMALSWYLLARMESKLDKLSVGIAELSRVIERSQSA